MKAEPLWGDIYIRFRDEDYGRVPVAGLEVIVQNKVKVFDRLDAALRCISKLHNNHLKGIK